MNFKPDVRFATPLLIYSLVYFNAYLLFAIFLYMLKVWLKDLMGTCCARDSSPWWLCFHCRLIILGGIRKEKIHKAFTDLQIS